MEDNVLQHLFRAEGSVRYQIDLAAIMATEPLHKGDDVLAISDPRDLWLRERIYAEHGLPSPNAVPCDVFVWAKGEAPDPRMTKIGGRPYLPEGFQWPSFRGAPGTFVAQFCFCDSLDLVSDLAGDILLVFMSHKTELPLPDDLHFLWVDSRLPNDAQRSLPEPAWPVGACYGVRHRTSDEPSLVDTMWVTVRPSARWIGPSRRHDEEHEETHATARGD